MESKIREQVMVNDNLVQNYRRNLPHIQVKGCVLFITWRLAFTLPNNLNTKLRELREEQSEKSKHQSDKFQKLLNATYAQKRFYLFDELLGNITDTEINLCTKPIDDILPKIIREYDNVMYQLHSYCIMPNHVHILIKPLPQEESELFYPCNMIMRKIKGNSSRSINSALGRSGKLWMEESYDRMVRNEKEYERTANYILNNPVKAGLVEKPEEWAYSYHNNGLV
ncbi:MAG: transposase [Candidatus Cloacimonetes bacterium]|nr:transposase [Candidatus Cloacimonadota bacterium]